MHYDSWHDGMDGGTWWWIPMTIMMIAFWGGLIWIGVTLVRRTHPALPFHPPGTSSSTAPQSAQEILADRLARGEIEPDDYRQRVDALRSSNDS